MSERKIRAEILTAQGYVNLRGNSGDKVFLKAVESVLGQALPVEPNTVSTDKQQVFWLGPDEWLLVAPTDKVTALVNDLGDALSKLHAAVNDVSGGNIAYRLSGADVGKLFAKGSTLDFHPDAFAVDQCAQSGLGKAAVLFGMLDDAPTFDVIVRRSFAEYLVKWLRHAGREYGIEFV